MARSFDLIVGVVGVFTLELGCLREGGREGREGCEVGGNGRKVEGWRKNVTRSRVDEGIDGLRCAFVDGTRREEGGFEAVAVVMVDGGY